MLRRLTPHAFLLLPHQVLRAGCHLQPIPIGFSPKDTAAVLGNCQGYDLCSDNHVFDTIQPFSPGYIGTF